MPPTGTSSVAITPQGVRDGDPAVLAALAERRGPAVTAFAEAVCEPQYVVRAAADAFARFRAAVADPSTDVSVHPDALLLRCARRAALELAPRGPELGCGPALELLVARAERTIGSRDAGLLNRHLEACEHCSDLSRNLDAADRAYREAEETPLPPSAIAPIVAAMAAAAPVAVLPSGPQRAQGQDSTPETEVEAAEVLEASEVAEPEAAEPEAEAPEPEAAPVAEEEPAETPEAEAQVAEPDVDETPVDALPLAEEEPEEAPEANAEAQIAEPDVAETPADALPPAEEETPEAEPEETEAPEAEDEPAASPSLTEGEPEEAPEPADDEPPREIPLGTRRVTGSPASYYQIPPPPQRERAKRAKEGAMSLRRRAGRAARKRLERSQAAPPPPPPPAPEPEPEVTPEEARIWRPVDSIEFPAVRPQPEPDPELAPDATPAHVGFQALEIPSSPYDEPDMRDSAARAAARHYRRLRHRSQEQEQAPPDGQPPRLERPERDRGTHLPLRAHGPRHLALPAALLVVAALVIMAVSGVFGGGSETPTTGTAAKAPAEVSLVTQSATSISLTDAERVAARAGTETP